MARSVSLTVKVEGLVAGGEGEGEEEEEKEAGEAWALAWCGGRVRRCTWQRGISPPLAGQRGRRKRRVE